MHEEFELKFQLPSDKAPSLRRESAVRGATAVERVDHYFDTAALDLAEAGLSLRLREAEGRWVQTVKAEIGAVAGRAEHEVPLPERPQAPLAPNLRLHRATEVGLRLMHVLEHAAEPALLESFVVRAARSACSVTLGEGSVEIALDEGVIEAAGRSLPLCEVEFESKTGDRRAVFALARDWIAPGRLWLNRLSKAQRGANLASGRLAGPPKKAHQPAVDGTENGGRLLSLVLRSTLEQVLANAGEVALGSDDEEHVHQLRVGLRRTRSALRELCPPGMVLDPAWEPTLAGAFRDLGIVRDNVTVAEVARPLLEHTGAPKTRWDVPHQDASSLVACIAAAPLQQVLLDLVELADLGASATTSAEPMQAAWKRVERHVARLHRKVLEDARRFDELPLDAQHRARKRLKRLRYLVEFVGGRWPDRRVRTYLAALEPAQDALGAHMDIATAQQRFMDDSRHDPRSYFAAGFLQNELKRTARDAGAALRRLRRAERFWRS